MRYLRICTAASGKFGIIGKLVSQQSFRWNHVSTAKNKLTKRKIAMASGKPLLSVDWSGLSRDNQHALCVAADQFHFSNYLHPCALASADALPVFESAGGIPGVFRQLIYCARFFCASAMNCPALQRSMHAECSGLQQKDRTVRGGPSVMKRISVLRDPSQ